MVEIVSPLSQIRKCPEACNPLRCFALLREMFIPNHKSMTLSQGALRESFDKISPVWAADKLPHVRIIPSPLRFLLGHFWSSHTWLMGLCNCLIIIRLVALQSVGAALASVETSAVRPRLTVQGCCHPAVRTLCCQGLEMCSKKYPGSEIGINLEWSLSTCLGGHYMGSHKGWMSLTTKSLGNALYQPWVPKYCQRGLGLVRFSLPCFAVGFVSVFNPQVQQNCLIWCEGM